MSPGPIKGNPKICFISKTPQRNFLARSGYRSIKYGDTHDLWNVTYQRKLYYSNECVCNHSKRTRYHFSTIPVVTNFFTKLLETYRPSPRHLVNTRRVDLHSRGGGVYSLQTMRLCLKGLPFPGVRTRQDYEIMYFTICSR